MKIFTLKPAASSVEWDATMLENPEKSWLDSDQPTLVDVFGKYFESFEGACGSEKSFFDTFNIYKPVRVVISDLAGFARDKDKPLADYDPFEVKPFWLQ